MATNKHRGFFRAVNIHGGPSEAEFKSVLRSKLTIDERGRFELYLHLAPCCINSETQTAIFKFKPCTPNPHELEPNISGPHTSETPFFLQTADPSFFYQGKNVSIDTNFYGLTQLFPVEPSETKIDIVALSGLNSHAYGSWIGPEVENVAPMWLRDFLREDSDLKYCRTMTFGYNTKYHDPKIRWIENYVDDLLNEIGKARRTKSEEIRPLVLIGHSFGGIIIAHACFRASVRDEYKNIYNSISRIFFFGVPFRGIDLTDVLLMLDDDEKVPSEGYDLVKGIVYETKRITSPVQTFKEKISQIRDRRIRIVTFYEAEKTPELIKLQDGRYGRFGDPKMIVDADSTDLGIPTIEEHLEAPGNHSTIVKFKNESNSAYQTIQKHLTDVIKLPPTLRDDQRKMISEILDRIQPAKYAAFNSYQDDAMDAQCHPGTRIELLSKIKEWAEGTEEKCIFWLKGMAGTGKSTISRTLAQYFEENGQLGASFFFKRGESERDNASKFFTTIATHLLQKIPDLIPDIRAAIDKVPDIATKILKKQFNELIFDPLNRLNKSSIKLVFVIDALDECKRDEEVEEILYLIAKMQTLKTVQIRILISSRPDLPVRIGFCNLSSDSYKNLILQDLPSIERDISVFLTAKFSEIKRDFNKIMPSNQLPLEWPEDDVIPKLTKISIPLFIFAATIYRFVRYKTDCGWNPKEQLATFLEHSVAGVSQLDQTYLPVLKRLEGNHSEQPKRCLFGQRFREIIGSIVVLADPLSIPSLANLLGKSQEDIATSLNDLHSVLNIPQDINVPVRLLHLSFREFLVDPAKEVSDLWFWIDEKETHSAIAKRCLKILSTHLKENICSLEFPGMLRQDINTEITNERLPVYARYCCRYWVHHLKESRELISDKHEAYTFLSEYFLYWIEALALIGKLSGCIKLIDTLRSITKKNEESELSYFLDDARRFLVQNWLLVNKAPLQLYSSAIIFSPERSIIRTKFWNHIPQEIHGLPKVVQSWGTELLVVEGDSDSVRMVAFSPDGKLLASGWDDCTIGLWDTVTGESLKWLQHRWSVATLAFSPDGKQLASGSVDKTIRLWDVVTGKELKQLVECHCGPILTVDFSSDGTQLASGSSDGIIRLWDTGTWKQLKHIVVPSKFKLILKVVFSPDGKRLISRSNDKKVRLWDVVTGRRLKSLKKNGKGSWVVGFSSDGKELLLGSDNGMLRYWDLEEKEVKQLKGYRATSAAAFSPDGKQLASGSIDGTIRLWNMEGEELKRLEGHNSSIMAVAFSPNGKQLASLSNDQTIRLWDLEGEEVERLKGHSKLVSAIIFSSDGKQLASGSYDGTIRLWNMEGEEIQQFKVGGKPVSILVFSSDGKQLGSGLDNGIIMLWDLATKIPKQLKGHTTSISAMDFSPDNKRLASGSMGRTFRLWNVETGAVIWMRKFSGFVVGVAFSSDGKQLALASVYQEIAVWDVATREKKREFKLQASDSGPPAFPLVTSTETSHSSYE
ncbi:hypothetical protein TWF730_011302 [Orbilia blumenaviensis]|uniref:Intraflagellar transport protein 122 homolog n=1 Tax=Orbilia blumenaviensis TaxID=1796055 RepID=A0AAV9UPG2_9PEZI